MNGASLWSRYSFAYPLPALATLAHALEQLYVRGCKNTRRAPARDIGYRNFPCSSACSVTVVNSPQLATTEFRSTLELPIHNTFQDARTCRELRPTRTSRDFLLIVIATASRPFGIPSSSRVIRSSPPAAASVRSPGTLKDQSNPPQRRNFCALRFPRGESRSRNDEQRYKGPRRLAIIAN